MLSCPLDGLKGPPSSHVPLQSVQMIRAIVRYGDVDLHRRAANVDEITPEIDSLIDDMVETMYAAPGIGLAAPQVGAGLRIFVLDTSAGRNSDDLIVMINPEIIEREGAQTDEEGCLSVPGFEAEVLRPQRAVVRGLDRGGQPLEIEGTGLLARAFQHELDHLDGTLFLDRLRGIKRELIVRRISKMRRAGKW